jgi:hypothetical protein
MTLHDSYGAQANNKRYTLSVGENKNWFCVTVETAETFYTVLAFTYRKKKINLRLFISSVTEIDVNTSHISMRHVTTDLTCLVY